MKNYDFLIVGGGIFGMSTAIELKKRNYKVALINPDQIPHPLAASTDISKIVRMEYGTDLFYMKLGNRAIDGWLEWNDFFKKTLYEQVGWLLACPKPLASEYQAFERSSYENLIKIGQNPERLTSSEISKRFPAYKEGLFIEGIFQKKAGYAHASKTISTLADYARKLDIDLFEGQTAHHLIVEQGKAIGYTTKEGGQFSAERTIVCAGPYSPYLVPGLKTFMRATGHPVFHIKPSQSELFTSSKLSVFSADTSNTGWYGFPLHPEEQVVKIANHGIGLELNPETDERIVTKRDETNLRTFLKNTFPSLANDPIVYTRRCVYSDTLDGDFWIDQHPEIEGLTIACGGSGHGFKFGPVIGEIIAAAALGEENPWLDRFRWRYLDKDTMVREEVRNIA